MMNKKSIFVYVEGEGGGNKKQPAKRHHLDGEFRQAWKQFLQPLADFAKTKGVLFFQCIPGRGGSQSLEKFAHPLPTQAGALRILLIDSERPAAEVTKPWKYLPKCKRPNWADDRSCYLMVQCLETWLLADPEAIRVHYDEKSKPCFRPRELKAWPPLETVDRKILQKALEKATENCTRPYFHAYGNVLIAVVSREKLMKLPSVERLFKDLKIKIGEYAAKS